jgi:hypothetical protein
MASKISTAKACVYEWFWSPWANNRLIGQMPERRVFSKFPLRAGLAGKLPRFQGSSYEHLNIGFRKRR